MVALYSVAHLPRERHFALYSRIAEWLRPGGLLLASLGVGDEPRSFDPATNRRLLEQAGFELLHDELPAMREGGGNPATFQWVLATRAVDTSV